MTKKKLEIMMPVNVTFKPRLRSDGELVRVTITQLEEEIQLTADQAKSLVTVIQARIGSEL